MIAASVSAFAATAYKDTATVDTYAIGLLKVNNKGEALANAVFEFPFYVNKTANANGDYVFAFTEYPTGMSDADKANYTKSITTPADGTITVVGVKAGTYSITETQAPNGYNLLGSPISVQAQKISSETWTKETERKWKIAEDGTIFDLETVTDKTTHEVTYLNDKVAATSAVAVNMTGSLLPSTGGIGTTIFYVAGGILVLAAVILLVTKRRMNAND